MSDAYRAEGGRFDVDAFLDSRPIGAGHVSLVGLLVLAMLLDGYDIFVVGMVLPFLARDMEVAPAALTSVFVVQQLGLLVGTFLVGPLSDRFGRRTTLLACIGAFTLLTFVTTQVATPAQLIGIRFASALFFAGVIPNCIALSSEIAPSRWRAAIVGIVFCGFTGGHFLGAFVQAYTLESYGWQSAFWLGGVLGVVVFTLLFLVLPESIRFRVRRDPADPRIPRALRLISPGLSLTGEERFEAGSAPSKARRTAPAKALFSPGMRQATLWLWLAFFCAFMVSQFMGSWSATVFHNMGGISMQRIAAAAAIGTTTGIIGTASAGFLIDRFGSGRALPAFFIGGALFTAALGLVDLRAPGFLLVYGLYGYFTNAALASVNALGSLIYPSEMRATGVSWAAGAGRAGGMVGPAVGGLLIAGGASVGTIYLCAGIPLLVGMAASFLIARTNHGRRAA
ncbi:MAG: transporter [Sphingomonas bacterium]|nr:transporter [Sphingomonas bacterium]